MDAKITNSNENKANPGNYSTQGFTGDPKNAQQYVALQEGFLGDRLTGSTS